MIDRLIILNVLNTFLVLFNKLYVIIFFMTLVYFSIFPQGVRQREKVKKTKKKKQKKNRESALKRFRLKLSSK